MTPLAAADVNREYNLLEQKECNNLYHELKSGIQSVKRGEVYTIEEAWEEIDRI